MKAAFWSLFALGVVLCATVGIGPTLQRAGGIWASPVMIGGSICGVALVALGVLFASGIRPAILASDARMLAALGTLLLAKVAISLGHAATAASRL